MSSNTWLNRKKVCAALSSILTLYGMPDSKALKVVDKTGVDSSGCHDKDYVKDQCKEMTNADLMFVGNNVGNNNRTIVTTHLFGQPYSLEGFGADFKANPTNYTISDGTENKKVTSITKIYEFPENNTDTNIKGTIYEINTDNGKLFMFDLYVDKRPEVFITKKYKGLKTDADPGCYQTGPDGFEMSCADRKMTITEKTTPAQARLSWQTIAKRVAIGAVCIVVIGGITYIVVHKSDKPEDDEYYKTKKLDSEDFDIEMEKNFL